MVGMLVLKPPQIVHHGNNPTACRAAILLAAHSAPNHLHISNRAKNLTRNEYHIGFWCVETGGEHGVVAQDTDFAALETVEEIAARHGWHGATDGGGGNASEVQTGRHLLGVEHRVAEEKNGALLRPLNALN